MVTLPGESAPDPRQVTRANLQDQPSGPLSAQLLRQQPGFRPFLEAGVHPLDLMGALSAVGPSRLREFLLRLGYDATVLPPDARPPEGPESRQRSEPQPLSREFAHGRNALPLAEFDRCEGEAAGAEAELLQNVPGRPEGGGAVSRARQAAYKAAKGIAGPSNNRKRHSQTPEGRRERLLRQKVDKGIYPDIEAADRNTPRRYKPTPAELRAMAQRKGKRA